MGERIESFLTSDYRAWGPTHSTGRHDGPTPRPTSNSPRHNAIPRPRMQRASCTTTYATPTHFSSSRTMMKAKKGNDGDPKAPFSSLLDDEASALCIASWRLRVRNRVDEGRFMDAFMEA